MCPDICQNLAKKGVEMPLETAPQQCACAVLGLQGQVRPARALGPTALQPAPILAILKGHVGPILAHLLGNTWGLVRLDFGSLEALPMGQLV